jgi:hypothetical protein
MPSADLNFGADVACDALERLFRIYSGSSIPEDS